MNKKHIVGKPKITNQKERSEAHRKLTKKGYKFFDNTSTGASYAKIEDGMLRKANINLFGRILYYVPVKATKVDKSLY